MKALRNAVLVAILVIGTFVVFLPSYASIIVTPTGSSEDKIDYRAQKLFSLIVDAADLPFTAELVIWFAPYMQGAAEGGCKADGKMREGVVYLTTAALQREGVMKFILAHEIGHLQQRVLPQECSEVILGATTELDADARAVMILNAIGLRGATIARNALIEICSQSGEGWRVICDGSGGYPSLEHRIRAVSSSKK